MKRTQAFLIFGILSTLLFVAAGMNLVTATPTQTAECSGCHTDSSTISVTSDVTGTVDANVGEAFTVSVDATGGALLLRIEKPWQDNSRFDYSTQLVSDNQAGDTNAAEGAITAEITITPLVGGDYTIRIWVGGDYPHANDLDIQVSVEGSTTGFTTTEPVNPSALLDIWFTLVYVLVPSVAIVLIILGIYIIRRA